MKIDTTRFTIVGVDRARNTYVQGFASDAEAAINVRDIMASSGIVDLEVTDTYTGVQL